MYISEPSPLFPLPQHDTPLHPLLTKTRATEHKGALINPWQNVYRSPSFKFGDYEEVPKATDPNEPRLACFHLRLPAPSSASTTSDTAPHLYVTTTTRPANRDSMQHHLCNYTWCTVRSLSHVHIISGHNSSVNHVHSLLSSGRTLFAV